MKLNRFLVFVLTIGALGLSACGAIATTPNAGSGNAGALPVAFIGIVDSIADDQWVISGTTVTVAPAVVQDGPFAVGDQVKVEGIVNTDGSFTVTRVEAPTPQDVSTLAPFGNDNTNDANINDGNVNINDANINDDNGNDANVNDDNGNANFNDNGTNTNDDNGGGNTNDDNGNDDSGGGSGNSGKGGGNDDGGGSGKGGGDDGGGDDHGGGGNSNDD